ncbi:hypothetical protein ABVT39_015089 [Epinephelus coioides]
MESPGSRSQAVRDHGGLGPFVHCNICTLAACDKVWRCDLPQNSTRGKQLLCILSFSVGIGKDLTKKTSTPVRQGSHNCILLRYQLSDVMSDPVVITPATETIDPAVVVVGRGRQRFACYCCVYCQCIPQRSALMSYEDNKAVTRTHTQTHKHRLPGAGDHTM